MTLDRAGIVTTSLRRPPWQRRGGIEVTTLCDLQASLLKVGSPLRMIRTTRLPRSMIGLLVALVLCVSACGGGTSVAASVGDNQIAVADVEAAYASRAGSSDLASQLQSDDSGEAERNLKAAVLTDLIRSEILDLAAEDRGIEVTDEEIAEQRTTVVESTGGEEALQQALERSNVTEEELEGDLRDQVIARKIGEGLSDDVAAADVQAAFETDAQGQFGPQIKVRHILTENENEAQDAIERIQSGEDFATVAQDLSTDTGTAANGGELGTVPKGATVAEFDDAAFGAKVGELVGPVQTQFGFHVIEVTEKVPAPRFADVEGDIRTQLQSAARSQAFNTYIIELVERLGVEVDEQYGTWNAQSLAVVTETASEPPAGAGSELPTQAAPSPGAPPSE